MTALSPTQKARALFGLRAGLVAVFAFNLHAAVMSERSDDQFKGMFASVMTFVVGAPLLAASKNAQPLTPHS